MSNIDHLCFPIGKFTPKETYTADEQKQFIQRIEALPKQVEDLAKTLTPQQLQTPYREGGWTALQVIHHMADSHMNAYIRFKWALTESTPTIKAYDEKAWAQTPEVTLHPGISIELLKALHVKWTALLSNLSAAEFDRQFIHPQTRKQLRLGNMLALYAWHGEHHLGHLKIVAAT